PHRAPPRRRADAHEPSATAAAGEAGAERRPARRPEPAAELPRPSHADPAGPDDASAAAADDAPPPRAGAPSRADGPAGDPAAAPRVRAPDAGGWGAA